MSACRRCGDLKREYGWACNDLRDAARKLVNSRGATRVQERVDQAKARKREAGAMLSEHQEQDHERGAA